MEGSWSNLYKSLENLDQTYIEANQERDWFLNPAAPVSGSFVPLLALNNAPVAAEIGNMYTCSYCPARYFTDDQGATCPSCYRLMSTSWRYVAPPARKVAAEDGGGIVKGVVTYMVMDDLEVKPMSTISSLALLNRFKVKDVSALEEKDVKLGVNEALKLLKASHQSKTVLTDVFC